MKKIIVFLLCIIVTITITFKIGLFKDIKVLILTKMNNIVYSISKTKNYNQTKEKLMTIIDDYEKKLDSYTQLVVKYEQLVKENNELRDLMSFKNESYTIIYADIVEKSLIYDYIIINKGKNNGIKEGNAVICSTAFIGIVKEVSNNSSTIQLINGIKYPVMNSNNSEMGSIQEYKDGYYIINDFKGEVNIGDYIVTSKYSVDIPSGLFIGTVENIEEDSFELSKKLKVKSGYDYKTINSVGVIVK